jgi:hypothetical protein
MNRETWLHQAAFLLVREYFVPIGINVPACRVSVGFPSRRAVAAKSRAQGECHHPSASADGASQVFVSPLESDTQVVLRILLHELIHVAYPDAGHKGQFVQVAKRLGFVGPWTSTPCGDALTRRLFHSAMSLGEYPHAALSVTPKTRPGSRLRLWVCDCGVKVRVASDSFNAQCLDCDSPFRRADAPEAPGAE